MKKIFKAVLATLAFIGIASTSRIFAADAMVDYYNYEVLEIPAAEYNQKIENIYDGNNSTRYHSEYNKDLQISSSSPAIITLELKENKNIHGLKYAGTKQGSNANGYIRYFEVWTKSTASVNPANDFTMVYGGTFDEKGTGEWNNVSFEAPDVRVIKIVVKSTYGMAPNNFLCINELHFITAEKVQPSKPEIDKTKVRLSKEFDVLKAPEAEPGYPTDALKDNDFGYYYHSKFYGNLDLIHATDNNAIIIELPRALNIYGIAYAGVGNDGGGKNGYINKYKVLTKETPGVGTINDYTLRDEGTWTTKPSREYNESNTGFIKARTIMLVALTTDGRVPSECNKYISCSELGVYIENVNYLDETKNIIDYTTLYAPDDQNNEWIRQINDGYNDFIYHSDYNIDLKLGTPEADDELIFELKESKLISGLNYITKEFSYGGMNGHIKDYEIYVKNTTGIGTDADYTFLTKGTFEAKNKEDTLHNLDFTPVYCRTIKIVVKSSYGENEANTNKFIHIAELLFKVPKLNYNVNTSYPSYDVEINDGMNTYNSREHFNLVFNNGITPAFTELHLVSKTDKLIGEIKFNIINTQFEELYTKTSLALRYRKEGNEITPLKVDLRFGGRVPQSLYDKNKEYGVIVLAENDTVNKNNLEASPNGNLLNTLKHDNFALACAPVLVEGGYYQFAWVINNIPASEYNFSFRAYLYEYDPASDTLKLASPRISSINDAKNYYLTHKVEMSLPQDVVSALEKIN